MIGRGSFWIIGRRGRFCGPAIMSGQGRGLAFGIPACDWRDAVGTAWSLAARASPDAAAGPSAGRQRLARPGALPKRSRAGDRLFWFLAIIAATAVAAWIVTRTLIDSGAAAGSHLRPSSLNFTQVT